MKGKLEVNATEIRKHCGADFLGVLMQVSDMAHSRTSSLYEFLAEADTLMFLL